MNKVGTGKKVTQTDKRFTTNLISYKPTAASGTTLPYPPNPRTSGTALVFFFLNNLFPGSAIGNFLKLKAADIV
jgi:hypothetical protein